MNALLGQDVRVHEGYLTVLFELALVMARVDAKWGRLPASLPIPQAQETLVNCLLENHLLTPRLKIVVRTNLVDLDAMTQSRGNATDLWRLGTERRPEGLESVYDNGGTTDFNLALPAMGLRYMLAELSVAENDLPAQEALAQLDLRGGHAGLLACANQLQQGFVMHATDKKTQNGRTDVPRQNGEVLFTPVHWGRAGSAHEATILDAYSHILENYSRRVMDRATGPVAVVATLHKKNMVQMPPTLSEENSKADANKVYAMRVAFFNEKKLVLGVCDFRSPGIQMDLIITRLLRKLDTMGLDHAEYDRRLYPDKVDNQPFVCHPSAWPGKNTRLLH